MQLICIVIGRQIMADVIHKDANKLTQLRVIDVVEHGHEEVECDEPGDPNVLGAVQRQFGIESIDDQNVERPQHIEQIATEVDSAGQHVCGP